MHTIKLALLCAAIAALHTTQARAQVTMTPLPGFGSGGWIAPGTTPYLTTGNTERGLAYNPQTSNLVLVARQNVGGLSNNIHVIDGATGADLFGFDNSGLGGGTFLVNMVDVDEAGAIYVCNLTTSATSPFKVYKWDSEAAGATTPPTEAYNAISGVNRTGDAFAVTGGSGGNPAQFAAAGSNNVNASNFVVGSLDGTSTSTAFLSVPGTGTTSNDYRLGLTFVDQNTLIGTQGGTARLTAFGGGTAAVVASIPLVGAAQRAMDYTVIGATSVLAVIDSSSSLVTVYDITNPTAPVVLATANNTNGTLSANGNGVGSVAWGAVAGSTATLYVMSTNQGIQGFLVDLGSLASATNYGTGCDGLALAANGVPTIGNSAFELAVNNVPAVAPVAFVGFGSTAVNPGTNLTVIGMAGCFAYTNLDIGLFSTSAVTAGTGIFALAIPSDPSLAGTVFAAQGVSFSLATTLQLASSNGAELVLGF